MLGNSWMPCSAFGLIQNIHESMETFGLQQKVLDIWHEPNMLVDISGRIKFEGPLNMDQMSYGLFLDRTKCLLNLG